MCKNDKLHDPCSFIMPQSSRSTIRLAAYRDLLLIGIPAVILVVGAIATTLLLLKPAPPKVITLSTGVPEGAYHAYGMLYRDALAQHGVTVKLLPSSGASQNLQRIADANSGVDVAFVQGGLVQDAAKPRGVQTLGSLYFEPLWVFYRGEAMDMFSPLRGKTVAVGVPNSGTAALARTLLKSNGLDQAPTVLLDIGNREAADRLKAGTIQAAFFMAEPRAPLMQELLHAPDIRLMHVSRADAYVRQFQFLSKLHLPRGVIDLSADIPARDIDILGTTANLLVRDDLHPALHYLLLRAASDIHAKGSLFSNLRQFPVTNDAELPMSPEADRYFRSGAPFLQRYLPFWAANLVDRLLVLIVPALAVLIPLGRLLPALYTWRVRSRIYRWYARLKEIELELDEPRTREQLQTILERLDTIEDAVHHLQMPLSYSEHLYSFRVHTGLVRRRTEARLSGTEPDAARVRAA